jgi:hypothetical protein
VRLRWKNIGKGLYARIEKRRTTEDEGGWQVESGGWKVREDGGLLRVAEEERPDGIIFLVLGIK